MQVSQSSAQCIDLAGLSVRAVAVVSV